MVYLLGLKDKKNKREELLCENLSRVISYKKKVRNHYIEEFKVKGSKGHRVQMLSLLEITISLFDYETLRPLDFLRSIKEYL